MREGKQIRSQTSRYSADFDPEENLRGLESKIQILRDSVRKAAERPDFFWKRQHNAIMVSLSKPVPTAKRRPSLVWAPIALGLILCLLLFVENSKAPTPDFAAGSDQELLVGIERALKRQYPEAFDPAVVIVSDTGIEGNHSRPK